MPNLDPIRTIVVVMMENRSFDHVLGYLSLPPFNRSDVNGLRADPAWLARFVNVDKGQPFQPFLSSNPYTLPDDFDPPHERSNVADQLGPFQNGSYAMNGFVSALPGKVSNDPDVRRLVMSYFGAEQAPTHHFLAENFTICDRWFCSLPAGTQPNRLMSMGGFSRIEVNQTPLPDQALVYDWLDERGITWRVYHEGLPFFALMPKWIQPVLSDDAHFRPFHDLEEDLMNTPPDQLPQVIFIEPTYGDAPHLGPSTDDHAPAGISDGQEFLMQIYNAVTASPSFWSGAVMVINYDEHGGFFDHVSPPLIATNAPPKAAYLPFASLGVRVPACVVSPFVKAGEVNHTLLDHTSVLKLLGQKFGAGSYSPEVDSRPVGSVLDVLSLDAPRADCPAAPPLQSYLAGHPTPRPVVPVKTVPPPVSAIQVGFHDAIEDMKRRGANRNHRKFGRLLE